jgi:hypothetical protein
MVSSSCAHAFREERPNPKTTDPCPSTFINLLLVNSSISPPSTVVEYYLTFGVQGFKGNEKQPPF